MEEIPLHASPGPGRMTALPVRWSRAAADAEGPWTQEPGAIGGEFRLSVADGLLRLECSVRGQGRGAGLAGEFTAELWRADAAELFLTNPATGRYLELNLSPTGAWWTCLFSAPRVPLHQEPWPLPEMRAAAGQDEAAWIVWGEMPEQAVLEALEVRRWAELRGNVCAISRGPVQSRFCSAAVLPGVRPDFHQPRLWLPIRCDSCGNAVPQLLVEG